MSENSRTRPQGSSRRARSFLGGIETLESRVVLSVTTPIDPTYGNVGPFSTETAEKTILESNSGTGSGTSASTTGAKLSRAPVMSVAAAATQLVITSQPTSVKTAAPFSITVNALDADGNVDTSYSGSVTLSLTTNPGNATVGGTLTVQAVNGVATIVPTLNRAASGYVFTASASGLTSATSAPITVTPAASSLNFWVLPPDGLKTMASFTVKVQAMNGAYVDPNYTGLVTIGLNSSPSGATLGGTLTVQAVDGVATFTGLTLDKSGGYQLKATAADLSMAYSTSFAVNPAATQLAITTQPPSSVKSGDPFSMTVTAKDASGNVDPNFSGVIWVSLATNPGNGMLSGTLSVQAVNGVATFTDLSLNKPASGYKLNVFVYSLPIPPVNSAAITVTPSATQLRIATQPPSSVKTGQTFSLVVNATDANGNVDPGYSGPMTLSLAANPGNGMLSGTLTVNAVHGVATFTGLWLNKPASGYLIKASATG
ncbi:hypothetical protein ACYOEI_19360, partial [Singulisphaera rosea]